MKRLVIFPITLLICSFLHAQDQFGNSIGLNVGTKGLGIDVGFAITPRIGVRGGFNYGDAKFEDQKIKIRRFNDEKVPVSGDLKLSTFDVVGELAILPFVRLAGGVNFTTSTTLADLSFKTSTALNVYDVSLNPTVNNEIRVKLENKRKVRPYASLNFGRLIPNRRIGFGVEIGAIFRADPKVTEIESAIPVTDLALLQKEIDSKGHVYPVVNVRVAIRL